FPVSREAVDLALEECGEWEGELVHVTREGASLVVASRQSLRRDDKGTWGTVLEINRDVTERRHAESLTRLMFERAGDSVAVLGRDYRFRRVNPVSAQRWKIPTETQMIGMHVADVVGREAFKRTVKPNLERCFAGQHV